jgi:hypothetical protein
VRTNRHQALHTYFGNLNRAKESKVTDIEKNHPRMPTMSQTLFEQVPPDQVRTSCYVALYFPRSLDRAAFERGDKIRESKKVTSNPGSRPRLDSNEQRLLILSLTSPNAGAYQPPLGLSYSVLNLNRAA